MGYLEIIIKLTDAMKWAFNNRRLVAEAVLIACLIFLGWQYNRKQEELSRVRLEKGQMEEGLKQEIRVRDGQLEVLRKEKGKVTVERVYVPPEGSVFIKQKDLDELYKKYKELVVKLGQAMTPEERERLQREIERLMGELKKPDTEIVIKDRGFTIKPGLGAEWSGIGIGPRLDLKLFYFKRYSALIGGGRGGVDVSASRHLDDILWGRPSNIEAFLGYKFLVMPGYGPVVLGIRMNF